MKLQRWTAGAAKLIAPLGLVLMLATPSSAQMPTDPADTTPLQAGQSMPDAEVMTVGGEATTLFEAVGDSPAIVVFYRGVW